MFGSDDSHQCAPVVTLRYGDCLAVLRSLPDESVDAVVTDPPYGLAEHKPAALVTALTAWANGDRERVPDGRGFMGKEWDAFVPPPAVWDECLRVLRPGGHLVALAGARTYDLMGLSIRMAGFEIRDGLGNASSLLAWCYGSGFPKSLNVNKDARFCQCVSDVRDAATDVAAESAAQVLLSEVHGGREDHAADIADLHGLPVDFRPDFAVSGGAEQDVFVDVRSSGDLGSANRSAVSERPAGDGGVRTVRSAGDALTEPCEAERGDLLQSGLPEHGEHRAPAGQPVRRDGYEATAPLRGGESGMEGWGDVQAGEGQLRRPALRPLSSGLADHGEVGRVRDGASPRDGEMGRPPADPHGVREPRGPQPAEQRPVESGSLADERGPQAGRGWPLCPGCGKPRLAPGLGTALKPAWEPIVLARKPLSGTVAQTVLAHGTGALNVDACRVAMSDDDPRRAWQVKYGGRDYGAGTNEVYDVLPSRTSAGHAAGRWPTNVLLTHGDACADVCVPGCPVAELDAQSGKVGAAAPVRGTESSAAVEVGTITGARARVPGAFHGDTGGASRFYPVFRYQAKAPTRERPKIDGQGHPTVKPLALMRWLVRLVTPPGGLVLDPFAGTGTTLQAARDEGFDCIGVERWDLAYRLACVRLGLPDELPVEVEPVDPILARITTAVDRPALIALWRTHKDEWTEVHTLASKMRAVELSVETGAA